MAALPNTIGELMDDAVSASQAAITNWEPHINAFVEPFAQPEAGETTGPLAGVPIGVKDLICTDRGHTTAASNILKAFEAPYDATVVQRLKEAGAVLMGKLNLDEFAMGASNEYSAFGPAKNPWDTTRVTGGSSGGSAAAVASGEVMAALGTDTGGSIRLPASFCGVVGIKPTYGRVSRFGVIAYASSFDQVGPVARTVKDAAAVLEVIAGPDPRDATAAPHPAGDYVAACGQDVAGLTIGIPKEYFPAELNGDVATTTRAAIAQLESLGATIKEVSLPLVDAAIPTYYLLVKAEASSNLARFDAIRYGEVALEEDTLVERYLEARGKYLGPEVKRSILMGTYALSAGYYDAWYRQASRVRTLIRREFEAVFEEVDILAGPVSTDIAFPIGSKADDPLQMYLADLLTVPASVAGLPALSVPCGFVDEMPVGLQLIGPHFGEERLCTAAHAYEQSQEWYQRRPKLPNR